jgi:hypothetical protein
VKSLDRPRKSAKTREIKETSVKLPRACEELAKGQPNWWHVEANRS